MERLIKKWARKRRQKKQRRHDFSEDIRRAERRKQFRRFAPVRWIRSASSALLRFRDPKWAQSRPMTKRGTKRLALSRGSYFNPLVWIWGLVRFIASWLTSRPYGSLAPALPAVLVLLGILTLVLWYRNAGRNWRETLYHQHLRSAIQQEDYPVALVSVNTLIDQNPFDADLRFQRAMIAQQMDQPQLCDYYMQQLAAGDHTPAIYWILENRYNDGPISKWEQDKQQRYAHYLTKLLRSARGQQLVTAKKLMGIYLSEMGLKAEAAQHLSELAHNQPDLLLTLAMLYQDIGDATRSQRYARDAKAYLQERLAADPINIETRISLAQTMLMLQDWEGSIRVLNEGRSLANDQRLTKALAESLAAASLQPNNPNRLALSTLDQRFKYAAAALKVDPSNVFVLDAITRILAETRDHHDKTALRASLVQGLDPDTMNFVRGTMALLDGREDEAIKHLQLAKNQGLNTPGILNNLAVAMSAKEGANLEEALKLANGALEMMPEHPYVLETRGTIYLKMNRYEDAMRDLEKSLAGVPQLHLKSQIYPSLIEACEGIGLKETAAEYQLLAEKTAKLLDAQRGANADTRVAEQ